MKNGRPLRFLALVLGSWTAARVAMLWPESAPEIARVEQTPVAMQTAATRIGALPPMATSPTLVSNISAANSERVGAPLEDVMQAPFRDRQRPVPASVVRRDSDIAIAGEVPTQVERPPLAPALVSPATLPTHSDPVSPSRSRLTVDTWLIARPSGGDDLAFGQLGGSQAGARLTYPLDRARRLALSGRLSAPLRGRGREAALGVDWQPTPLPVHLLIEQRLPIDGGAARPAVQLIAGVSRSLPLDLRLDAYGQAGAVHRRGGFADGAMRVTRPLLRARAGTVDLGAGSWGAAQRGAARLDVGPTLGIALPVGGGTVRLSADYRFRIAGRARPGSGPAVTIGSSF